MKKLFNLSNYPDLGIFILRVSIGLLMARHGYPKFLDLWAGNYADFPDPLHVGAYTSLLLTVSAELGCSILIIFGIFTRLSLIPLILCMLVVIFVFHLKDKFDVKEHALLYLIAYLTLFFTGPGAFSFSFFPKQSDTSSDLC